MEMTAYRQSVVGAFALLMSAPALAAPPAKDCEVMAYLIQQARMDFDSIKGKQIGTARCLTRGSEFSCFWAFPGDNFSYAEADAERMKRCVAAAAGAQQVPGKGRATEFEFEPGVKVTLPEPEIDRDGKWSVGFKIRRATTP